MANKYKRTIGKEKTEVDVYDVLLAFDVRCPAIQHAIKKLLAPGKRGAKSEKQDVEEALLSLQRSLELMSYTEFHGEY